MFALTSLIQWAALEAGFDDLHESLQLAEAVSSRLSEAKRVFDPEWRRTAKRDDIATALHSVGRELDAMTSEFVPEPQK